MFHILLKKLRLLGELSQRDGESPCGNQVRIPQNMPFLTSFSLRFIFLFVLYVGILQSSITKVKLKGNYWYGYL